MSTFLNGPSYLALPRDPQRWVIKDLIPVGGLTNIYGKPKAGKSFACLGMAHAIATDDVNEWLTFPVHKHGNVAYLQIDTPRGEWSFRILKMQEAGYDLSRVFFADMLLAPYPFNILLPEHQAWLQQQLEAIQPIVVFIDTLREAHNGDENDSTIMRNVTAALVATCRGVSGNTSIVLLSHARKDTIYSQMGGDDLMSDARGSSYIAGRMDAVIKMTGNGEHATGMTYKGRSVGQGRLDIGQDPETGLIVLDPKAAAYKSLLQRRVLEMRLEDPDISVNKMAEQLATETNYRKKRAITDDISGFLNIPKKLRKK